MDDTQMERHVFWDEAYQDGLNYGKADRLNGVRNEYTWNGALDTIYSYTWHYSRGYRDAWSR